MKGSTAGAGNSLTNRLKSAFSPVGALTLAQQTVSPKADFSPQPRLYAVSTRVLAVELPPPQITVGEQMPYQPQPGDIQESDDQVTYLKRGDRYIGRLIGENKDILLTYDQLEAAPFDLAAAESTTSYAIASEGDSNYRKARQPTTVDRKSKPFNTVETMQGRQWPANHTFFLHLPHPLQEGETYQLTFAEIGLGPTDFTYSSMEGRSEAVHVSQLGFRPDDDHKVGYLSSWIGTGGGIDYPGGLTFHLVDQGTDQPVYTGTASLSYNQNRPEDPKGRNYTLTEVHELDFSEFDKVGNYRLCVEGVGCSFDFEISPEAWQSAFEVSARGFYHQRSGIAIGEPYSEFSRARAFHPDDGVEVYQSEAKLEDLDMGLGLEDTFAALVAAKTDEIVPNAWGGYFDAGDWDRRTQHLAVSRGLLELHNLFPDYFKSISLNIPESSNELPDILDEALWTLDFFRRLQTPEGGIRGGIESAEHPKIGETSWQESLTVMAYAPDVWSSYTYAGVAARAAHTLQDFDTERAEAYKASALKAMDYAEAHYDSQNYQEGQRHHVTDQRNLAALELYRLTGDRQWHELFLETTVFTQADVVPNVWESHEQRDAAFLYARLNRPTAAGSKANTVPLEIDPAVQENARSAFLQQADALVELTRTTAFGWSKDHPEVPVGWGHGLGAPQGSRLLQAHALTGNNKYLAAGISSAQFSGGANPDNLVFTTGLGKRYPQNPLVIDQRLTGQAPPPGITVYGPSDFAFYGDFWTIGEFAPETSPSPWDWPAVESYFDVYLYPIATEFTVDYMLHSAYTWGYLAAR